MVEIEIDNYPDFTFSDTCQIFFVLFIRACQHPLLNSIILVILSLTRLCPLVLSSTCEEALHKLMVSCMSIETVLWYSPRFLITLLMYFPSVHSVNSHLYLLLLLFLCAVFDVQNLYIYTFSMCVTLLS